LVSECNSSVVSIAESDKKIINYIELVALQSTNLKNEEKQRALLLKSAVKIVKMK
jgi:hypothetical protein